MMVPAASVCIHKPCLLPIRYTTYYNNIIHYNNYDDDVCQFLLASIANQFFEINVNIAKQGTRHKSTHGTGVMS